MRAATGASFLLFVLGTIWWVRSYQVRDVQTLSDGTRQHVFYSEAGQIDWIVMNPAGGPPGGERRVTMPYAVLVGLALVLPLARLIGRTARRTGSR